MRSWSKSETSISLEPKAGGTIRQEIYQRESSQENAINNRIAPPVSISTPPRASAKFRPANMRWQNFVHDPAEPIVGTIHRRHFVSLRSAGATLAARTRRPSENFAVVRHLFGRS